MFTLLGKVITRVCDKIFDPYDDQEEHVREDDDSSDAELTEETSDRTWLEGEPLVGQVTHLNNLEQYGLINDEFYFELSLAAGEHLSVGMLVLFRHAASRSGRRVHELSILPGPPPASTVAKVVGLTNRGFHLLDDSRPAMLQQGYEPEFEVCSGDWVRLHFDEKTSSVTAVEALRSKYLVSQVTHLTPTGGIINQEIAFSAKQWPSDAPSPCVGLRVAVRAIESDQGSLTWRAISLELIADKAPKSPPLPPPPSLKPAALLNGGIGSKRAPIPRGLDVPKTIDFGQLEPGKSHTLQLCITNGTGVPHLLLACKLSSSTKQVAHARAFQPTLIASGDKHSLDLVCTASQVGVSHERIELEFEEGFVVYCVATVSVVDPLERQLQSTMPLSSSVRRTTTTAARISQQVLWTVPGEQCPMRKGKLPVGLPHFPVNAKFWKMSRRELERFVSISLRQPLQPSNYVEKLQLLLHLEEVQHTRELQEQTLCPALMRLEAQGTVRLDLTDWLGEARPPPRLGDRVIVRPVGGDTTEGGEINYEGFVHRVVSEDALLRFSPTFNQELATNPLQRWELRFLLNRTPLRRCHLAVRLCKPLLHSVLFPREAAVKGGAREQPLKLVNEQLNELQQEAVKGILASHRSAVPFVVWGPPGTGKTVTLVEAILQVYLNISHSRMLVCAPSNSAADLLTEKLWASGLLVSSDIVRLLGFQRDLDAVPASIRPLCVNTNKLERASHHRIVVSTIVTAGALYGLGLPADHFTHGFLDEAGQATEPECLVLAGLVCLAGGSLVLCGDPMQLGPVLRSRLAARGGLGESMLHRLLLGDGGASARCALPYTRLRNSYRCVQALLDPYSKLFYDGQLLSCVKEQERGPLPAFPVFFHGVRGGAFREGACPSWFNPSEAMQVMHYLQRAYGPWGLLPADVGLLTPYRLQTLKLRSLITSLRLPACKIGSAEEFQGQERRLIVVSTVRGSEALVNHGSGEPHQSLDFLFCARRFNVAISRASAMLVVVGNPDVLTLDKHWKSLMDYCAAHGTYHGCRADDVAAL